MCLHAGVGPVTALKLIVKHGNIEGVLASLDKAKKIVPEPYPYQAAREFFKAPIALTGAPHCLLSTTQALGHESF